MTEAIPASSDPGPLYHGVPLPHGMVVPILGIPCSFESNAPGILDAVDRSFGVWRRMAVPPAPGPDVSVRVRLVLHDADEGADRPIPIRYRALDPDRFLAHTPGSLGIVDVARREAVAYVSRQLLDDRSRFGYGFLEPLALLLVTMQDRQPVHAAVVARGSSALLLAGPTGVGKSTLAYQAYREGWRVLSDDAAYVQVRPTFRVWGMPGRLYLQADGRRHFAGLTDEPRRLPSGKDKIVVDLDHDRLVDGAPVASRAGVCLLQRDGGSARLRTAPPDELATFLEQGLGIQGMFYRSTMQPALSRLCARGGWRLNLSSDPGDALPYIEQMFAEIEAQP